MSAMMNGLTFDLPTIWAGLIAFAVLAYVVLDGFDLGLAVLFPFFTGKAERDEVMNSVAPVWDGNETWLVLGGGGLFAVFPLAYAVIMPALYPLIIAMLLALAFRGVAFEFRFRADTSAYLWDWAFWAGSSVAALCQGVMLGALVQGIKVSGRAYAGGWLDWLTPFSLLTGVALVLGYALLGACWLVYKTEHAVQRRAYQLARPLAPVVLLLMAAISLWTPFLNQDYWTMWFGWPRNLLLAPLPLACGALGLWLIKLLNAEKREAAPFLVAQTLFVLCYVGIGVSFHPYIVPRAITIHEAAAPESSLAFLLAGASVLIPVILIYTGYAYWVFRGKTNATGGYH
jgi:cytochrome d ubiquinol oxidase subunit II